MHRFLSRSLALVSAVAVLGLAAPSDAAPHELAVTISPIHLAIPVVELTGEYKLVDRQSAALILGAGTSGGVGAFEIGGQYAYYLLGNFDHGLKLGLEGIFVAAGGSAGTSVTAVGGGVSVGPFLAYKIAFDFGLTFDLGAGAQYVFITASDGTNSASADGFGLLLNLNAGWSF